MRSTRSRARQGPGGFSLIEVLVALALLAIGVVSLMQLFSGSLGTVRKGMDHSTAMIHARSLMDEAYGMPGVQGIEGSFELKDGFAATRAVRLQSTEGDTSLHEITITVTWPPSGRLELRGLKTVNENKR